MDSGPLRGLRVVEMTGDDARLAGKMLTEAGASVVRVGPAFGGPAMADPAVAARGGLLDWWFDGGKDVVVDDLTTEAGQRAYRRLAERADLVIETSPPGRLAELGLDHDALVEVNPRLVQVSLTPFGRTGPRAHWQTSDLVAGALGGVLSVSGTADHPVNPWGRQNVNFGSFMAAICGLAGVWDARESGVGQHVDLSLHESIASSLEHLFFQWWFSDLLPLPKRALRQGSLHWLGAYVVANARTGACNISTAPNPALLFEWMAEEGDPEGAELAALPVEEILGQMPRVMAAVKRFALTKDSGELFAEAQRRHIAFGEVQTVAQVAANPQYEHRGSFRPVESFPDVRMPGPFARFNGSGVADQQPPPAEPSSIDEVLARWGSGGDTPPAEGRRHRGSTTAGKPLEGLRVVDFTWVLAGPHATRIMGDLGADILKFQTAERATLVNSPGFPFFYVWNRSKRLMSLDMKRSEALAIIRKVVEQSDVLMENFSAGVLARWGLDYESDQGVESRDRLRVDERTWPRRSVVQRDHICTDDPRAVRPDIPVEPARSERRRTRVLPQRPRRRDGLGRRGDGGPRGTTPHGEGRSHRHRPDGDGHVPDRPGGARPLRQRSGRPPHGQRRSVRPVLPERGLPVW